MVEQDGPLNVAILAVPEVTASALYGMFDLFSSPGRDFLFITQGAAGEQRMRPYVVARGDWEASRAIGARTFVTRVAFTHAATLCKASSSGSEG
jgi:hypothetical protein